MNNNDILSNKSDTSSLIDPYYLTGSFFGTSQGEQDTDYKVAELRRIIEANIHQESLNYVADVGCGTGRTTFALQEMLSKLFSSATVVDGYDIHPQIEYFEGGTNVHFFQQDFAQEESRRYDLVVLFDVVEHVPDPITFLRAVSNRGRYVALHIPLDKSWLSGIRNLWRSNLNHPGHLIVLDVPNALNLLTFSGLRIRDYTLSPAFTAPSGRETALQKALYPFRWLLFQISPFILQQFLGGVSLTVIAESLAFDAYEAKI